ncbi:hypothetical protein [Prevotella sp.]|uniref:hypothetical protein n=1 Tax=Prevotella sp. TaxID=59823 RepID=UPI002ABDAEDC|nr:hypothetical protein [Prevotella sp.]
MHTHICTIKIQRRSNQDTTPPFPIGDWNSKASKKNRSIQKKIGNPTEGALLKWISGKGYDYDSIRDNANIAKVVPFSTEIKRMETTTTDGELFIKGAPEVVIGMCDTFNKISKDDAFSVLKEYKAKGMRTLAFAYKKRRRYYTTSHCSYIRPCKKRRS